MAIHLPSKRIKNSFDAMKKAKGFTRKAATGSLPKRLATGLTLQALKPRAKYTEFLTVDGKQGFETVFDTGIDREKCFCGKTNCKVRNYDIPQETLERFYSENFSCEKIVDCIKANKSEFLKSEKIVLETKVYQNSIHNLKADIRQNENLLSDFKIVNRRELLDVPFMKKSKKIVSKIVSEKITLDKLKLSEREKDVLKLAIYTQKNELKKLYRELEKLQTYKIPVLLSIDEQKKIELDAENLPHRKQKRALYRVILTKDFLASFINPNLD